MTEKEIIGTTFFDHQGNKLNIALDIDDGIPNYYCYINGEVEFCITGWDSEPKVSKFIDQFVNDGAKKVLCGTEN